MSINNATPADWDRLRRQAPALEVPKPTIDESLMKAYLDAAQEEFNKEVKETEWWKQHIENLESLDTESSVSSQPYQPVPKEVEELLSTDEGQKQWLAEWEAKEEFDKEMKETEWWKQHIENLERVNKEEKEMSKEELESQIFYEEEDMVGAPRHYNTGNIECIEAIEESMSSVAFKGYLKGNCMKYLWRYDYKGKQVEDLQKAQWYLAKLTQVVVFENGDNS